MYMYMREKNGFESFRELEATSYEAGELLGN